MSSEDRFFESVIRKALPHHFDVQFCMTDTYQTIEPSNEGISNVYIRPLHHLVSLPLQNTKKIVWAIVQESACTIQPSYLQCGLY